MKSEPARPGEEQRDAIREWMIAVMKMTGWAARHWAGKVRTSPSNITRFVKHADAAMPTWKTMAKLASVAPIPPPGIDPSMDGELAPLARELVDILGRVETPRQQGFVAAARHMADLWVGPTQEVEAAIPPSKKGRG